MQTQKHFSQHTLPIGGKVQKHSNEQDVSRQNWEQVAGKYHESHVSAKAQQSVYVDLPEENKYSALSSLNYFKNQCNHTY